jgi:hypothetical protein
VEVYKLSDELSISSVEIISIMKKLGMPVELPNPTVSKNDAEIIRSNFNKRRGFSSKNLSFFISAVISLTLILSINGEKVFANDTATTTQETEYADSTPSEPTADSLLAFKKNIVTTSVAIKDPFTVMVQEKLINLGLLNTSATGVNDKKTQEAIMSFQEKAGLKKIDGMVGPETFTKLLLGKAAYTTTASPTSDSKAPMWGDTQLKFMRVNGTYLDVLWGHVTDETGIDKMHLYVDEELHTTLNADECLASCSSTTNNMRFTVTNLTVNTSYEFKVVACDKAGNCSVDNPTATLTTVDKPPVWNEHHPLTVTPMGTRLNLNIPVGAVSDDIEFSYYEVYVNGALSTFRTISDTRLFVLPKYDTHCGPQELYVLAYDSIGQFSKSPVVDFTRNLMTSLECSVATSSGSATTTTTTTTVPTGKLADCGDSTTNANLWVVAVIDENDSSANAVTQEWSLFRTGYPDRCFHLLEPYNAGYGFNGSNPNGISSNIVMPAAFINELSAGTTFHARVNRDNTADVEGSADWWDLIGADILPSGAKIGLCIDNSGSMTVTTVQASLDLFEQKAAAAGVTIIPGIQAQNTDYYCINMSSEEWISGLKVNIN